MKPSFPQALTLSKTWLFRKKEGLISVILMAGYSPSTSTKHKIFKFYVSDAKTILLRCMHNNIKFPSFELFN
jgi:hypothetical protein